MTKLTGKPADLLLRIGHEFEPSRWIEVDQARINAFADCTEDQQFIHVDPESAAKTPLGGTIAHGFLVLSLLAPLCTESTVVPDDAKMGLNYGFNKIRFLAPVRSGKRIRAQVKVANIDASDPSRLLVNHAVTVEIENETRPALIAEWLIAWTV